MKFNLYRHIRMAGTVVLITSVIVHNINLCAVGFVIFTLGYQLSIHAIEKYLEEKEKEDAL